MTRFSLFYHSVVSDWNHGNAHFLRGLMRSLQARGHQVTCYEQHDNWSLHNLFAESPNALAEFEQRFPDLRHESYALDRETLTPHLRSILENTDVALVHEWNEPWVINLLGELCQELGVRAVFHDTHYRVVMDASYREQLGLERFDEILAFSPSVAGRFQDLGFRNVHVVHEAADTTVFAPLDLPKVRDVVFVGNYGDTDRSAEIEDYIFAPRLKLLELTYAVYGVRYPEPVLQRMKRDLHIDYRGGARNVEVPTIYSSSRLALHVPRRQYVELLPGTPTIRVFEALATGACLVSLPWPDTDNLFRSGDFAVVHTPAEMADTLRTLSRDQAAREEYGRRGLETIRAHHTCGHRADQLLAILGLAAPADAAPAMAASL